MTDSYFSEFLAKLASSKISYTNNICNYKDSSDVLISFSFEVKADQVILPAREGEYISDTYNLPTSFDYSLTYPGTASTCSIVLMMGNGGIFIGGKPNNSFTKIKVRRLQERFLKIEFISTDHDFIFLPFEGSWESRINDYRSFYGIETREFNIKDPKFLLQIGTIAPDSKPNFRSFSDLKRVVDKFVSAVGEGHIIHFFGTDSAGFDRMFPRYEISNDLGGESEFVKLLEYIHTLNLKTSHHFIPRIADYNWVKENPKFRDALIYTDNYKNVPIVELYKSHPFYVMNPNDPLWFSQCLNTVKRLHSYGVDFVQLDQFTYQRNFYDSKQPIIKGYEALVNEVEKCEINYWLEGVCDTFDPKGLNFSQILVRNTPHLWDNFELRRGYPFGSSYPSFFTKLYPSRNYSYQLITENKSVESYKQNLAIAKEINASVYDFQMDYYGETYDKLLDDLLIMISSNR